MLNQKARPVVLRAWVQVLKVRLDPTVQLDLTGLSIRTRPAPEISLKQEITSV